MIRIYPLPFSRLALSILALAMVLSACDSSSLPEDPEVAQLAADEAAEVVASALADTDGGLVASLDDMTAAVSHDGLGDAQVVRVGQDRDRLSDRGRHRACRGSHALTYEADSGTHRVQYQCGLQSPNLTKSFAADLAYQFRSADGAFVARPWQNWSAVDSIAFEGEKSGLVERTRRNGTEVSSNFDQTGSWTLSSLSGSGPALLAGSQLREGLRTRTTEDGTSTRSFSVQLSSDEIQIAEGDDGLARSVTGTVEYLAIVEIETPRRSETKEVRGTLELDGSGRALMRVFGLPTVYRISLHDGEQDGSGSAG